MKPHDRKTQRRGEAGSAYVLALIVLAILSIIGLSLAFITQGEVQVGSNERIATRVFYSADSGISASIARALVAGDYEPKTHTFTEPGLPAGLPAVAQIQHEVAVSAFHPLLDEPCDLCEINNAGTYNERSYRKINHGVTAVARRVGREESQKTVAAMVELLPWKAPIEAYIAANDPAELAKIKF